MKVLHHDFETRSRVDLKSCGAHRYAIDPTTDIFMMSAGWHDSEEVKLWVNPRFATPDLLGDNEEVEEMIREAEIITAHNAPFEQAVTWGAVSQKKSCPFKTEPRIEQYRCTAAVARKAGLPWSLDQLGEALNLATKKDKEGKALINFFSIPRKDGKFNEPKDFPEKWEKFCDYCCTDVRVERMADRRLAAFSLQGESLATFHFDLRMNQRGIPVNIPAVRNAQKIVTDIQSNVTVEFRKLTGLNPTQGKAFKKWLGDKGLNMVDLTAESVEFSLTGKNAHGRPDELWIRDTGSVTYRALELYQKCSYAAVKKFPTMLDWACPDGRMRGVLRYYGAGTGRWSAGGPQIQNAKVPTKTTRPFTEIVYRSIWNGCTAEGLDLVYDDVLEVLSCCVRHFIHDPKQAVLDGDYNAVEARIICWLAGQEDALEEYRQGIDRYTLMAARIYGVPESEIKAKGRDSTERSLGKQAVLGCGFGLGRPKKFQDTCWLKGRLEISEKLAESSIKAYRQKHPLVVQYWWKLDQMAKQAVRSKGNVGPFSVRKIAGLDYLLFKLRSGRSIAYPIPQINRRAPTKEEREAMANGYEYSEDRFMELTYWGQLPLSTQWGRIKLYGGKLAENETQATAADIMAHGSLNAERLGMPPFALIHDQALAFQPPGKTAQDFEAALADLPKWAKGLPLKVEAKVTPFYTK